MVVFYTHYIFKFITHFTLVTGTENNFAKYNNDTVTDFGVAYDYGSVMHYPEKAFSKNGNKTIVPLQVPFDLFIKIVKTTSQYFIGIYNTPLPFLTVHRLRKLKTKTFLGVSISLFYVTCFWLRK